MADCPQFYRGPQHVFSKSGQFLKQALKANTDGLPCTAQSELLIFIEFAEGTNKTHVDAFSWSPWFRLQHSGVKNEVRPEEKINVSDCS